MNYLSFKEIELKIEFNVKTCLNIYLKIYFSSSFNCIKNYVYKIRIITKDKLK